MNTPEVDNQIPISSELSGDFMDDLHRFVAYAFYLQLNESQTGLYWPQDNLGKQILEQIGLTLKVEAHKCLRSGV